MIKIGWKKTELNHYAEEQSYPEEKGEKKLNETLFYFFYSVSKALNPFSIEGTFMNKNIPILLDTGADLSLIPSRFLSKDHKISESTYSAKAANGQKIPIIGIIEKLTIKIGNINVFVKKQLSQLVT